MLLILFISFFILLSLGLPIAIVMGLSGIFTFFSFENIPGVMIAQRMFTACDNFSLMAIPFFMLAAELMKEVGVTKKIIKFSNALVGHIRGGLGHTTVVSGMIFAGISGSSNADAAAIGSIMAPAMVEEKYSKGFTVSLIAGAAGLGPIIPPSIIMIIYSSVTGLSVAALFLAGIIPGIFVGILLMVLTFFYAKRKKIEIHRRSSLTELKNTFLESFWALIMPVIIIFGILSGIFTATEAGVVAAAYGFILGFAYKKLTLHNIRKMLTNAALSTAIPVFAICTASIIGWILAREQFPEIALTFLVGISTNPTIIFLLIVAFMLVIGLFIEAIAAMLMVIPILQPILMAYGYDPVHFAMIILLTIVVASITPPVGMVLYLVCGIAKAKIEEVIKPVWLVVGVLLIAIIVMILFPGIITWLPNTFYK